MFINRSDYDRSQEVRNTDGTVSQGINSTITRAGMTFVHQISHNGHNSTVNYSNTKAKGKTRNMNYPDRRREGDGHGDEANHNQSSHGTSPTTESKNITMINMDLPMSNTSKDVCINEVTNREGDED